MGPRLTWVLPRADLTAVGNARLRPVLRMPALTASRRSPF